jgi:hypothetical protein
VRLVLVVDTFAYELDTEHVLARPRDFGAERLLLADAEEVVDVLDPAVLGDSAWPPMRGPWAKITPSLSAVTVTHQVLREATRRLIDNTAITPGSNPHAYGSAE